MCIMDMIEAKLVKVRLGLGRSEKQMCLDLQVAIDGGAWLWREEKAAADAAVDAEAAGATASAPRRRLAAPPTPTQWHKAPCFRTWFSLMGRLLAPPPLCATC